MVSSRFFSIILRLGKILSQRQCELRACQLNKSEHSPLGCTLSELSTFSTPIFVPSRLVLNHIFPSGKQLNRHFFGRLVQGCGVRQKDVHSLPPWGVCSQLKLDASFTTIRYRFCTFMRNMVPSWLRPAFDGCALEHCLPAVPRATYDIEIVPSHCEKRTTCMESNIHGLTLLRQCNNPFPHFLLFFSSCRFCSLICSQCRRAFECMFGLHNVQWCSADERVSAFVFANMSGANSPTP